MASNDPYSYRPGRGAAGTAYNYKPHDKDTSYRYDPPNTHSNGDYYGRDKSAERKPQGHNAYDGREYDRRNDSGYGEANHEDKANRDYQYYIDNYNKKQNDDNNTLSPHRTTDRTPRSRSKSRERTPDPGDRHKAVSVRRKYYEQTELDDVLQDKIATQLRENGIAETKVLPLSAKITQAVRDDVVDSGQSASPQVTANLTETIHKHLDPILYNKPYTTDLSNAQKPSDATHLSNLVLLRAGQVREEIELCKLSIDDPLKNKGRNKNTPREDPPDRSQLMSIKDGIEKQKTEKEILQDKLKQAQKETDFVEDDKEKREQQLQDLDAENWQLKRDLSEAEQDKQSLIAKVREQQKDYDRLDKANQESRHENMMMKKRLEDSQNQNGIISRDLSKLQSENARLQVLADQKEKEILHLRDPDKDMVHQIRILSDEVTLLRTQTRRLNEEKGMLKSRTQKMESSLDESYKQRNKLSSEKDNLWRENQDLKQRYRKLALAAPKQRTLPDIMTGRNGPSSRATSRNDSRTVRRSDDKRMSPTREEDERDYH